MQKLKYAFVLVFLSFSLTGCGFGCDVCNDTGHMFSYTPSSTCCSSVPW